MNRIFLGVVSLLTCTALLASGEVNAQARGTTALEAKDKGQQTEKVQKVLDTAARARKMAELDAWLRRLVGRYRVDGTVEQLIGYGRRRSGSKPEGFVDCVGVGDGPGVQCVLKVTWQPISWVVPVPRPVFSEYYNTMRPAMMLFGLDPDALGIHFLYVDDHSLADGGFGLLTGNTVVFNNYKKYLCDDLFASRCPRAMRISANPQSKIVNMEMTWQIEDTRFGFMLHRLPHGQAGGVSKLP